MVITRCQFCGDNWSPPFGKSSLPIFCNSCKPTRVFLAIILFETYEPVQTTQDGAYVLPRRWHSIDIS